jgi:hypothetical protein
MRPIHVAHLDKARPVVILTPDALGAQIGVLLDRQEPALAAAIQTAFDLV